MRDAVDILDVLTITEDLPNHGLYRGQIGTVVETLAPNEFEVAFPDARSHAYAALALDANQILVIR